MAKKEEEKLAKMSSKQINDIINKKMGMNVAFSLKDENPSQVKEWISTGSRWLDSIIARGKLSGIPTGKIVELAGLEGAGKSYMAAQIAVHAQKKDIQVIYFDSESAVDPEFLEKIGMDLSSLTYVQAHSVEFVLKSIEEILSNSEDTRYLFIWDSLANTPSESDLEDDNFNPQSSMARIPRITTIGMKKLTIPIANAQSTLLVLNQLKTNIGDPMQMRLEPWFTPGGKSLHYAYSLRIWLTGRKAKDSFIINDKGYRIGSEVKAKIKKSRFGTEGRECAFKIIWGDDPVGIRDEESWLEAIRISDRFVAKGGWRELTLNDGTLKRFQESTWLNELSDSKFRDSVLSIMNEEIIQKFHDRTGDANSFYNLDNEQSS